MFSFLISLFALILGYIIYGLFVEYVFRPSSQTKTPALIKTDGVDYVPMPAWKVYMIQFLNIAGTGPIFGAIMGAMFGPSSFLWIVLGSIFAGGVHDYFCGMLSIRHGGATMPDIIGHYFGRTVRSFMLVFSMLLLLLVGVVFVYSPALILGEIAPMSGSAEKSILLWVFIVFIYYVIATLLPVDKLIGRIYPLFAISLLFMAVALCVCLFVKWPSIPEFWDGLGNMGPGVGLEGQPIFPCLFITIACGAISGFHSTQSPLMARCIKNEKQGRPIFYGAMITEGIVALIWAAVSSYFFFDGGKEAVGALSGQAPDVVTSVARSWLGIFGGILAVLGVVAAPITSGDTAFRSARLILADFLHMDQQKKLNRLYIAIPLFAVAVLLLWYNIADKNGFNTIWRYFGWANQTLACFTLWTATDYLTRKYGYAPLLDPEKIVATPKRPWYFLTMIPACFMTSVCVTYIFVDKVGFNLPDSVIPYLGIGTFLLSFISYYAIRIKNSRKK